MRCPLASARGQPRYTPRPSSWRFRLYKAASGSQDEACTLVGLRGPDRRLCPLVEDWQAGIRRRATWTFLNRNRVAMSNDRVPMTREGYEKLKADIERMSTVEMIEVTKRIATARDLGDLSENAEYHAAREDQGMLQARIDAKRDQLARANIVDRSSLPSDTVVFGTRVKIKDLDSGEEEVYELVGPGDEDYDNNKILTTSPRGQGLLGTKVGDVAEIKVPRGVLRYQILEIAPYVQT
jgi:transcription elongation factor GreA